MPLDWQIESLGTDVEAAIDASVAHTGSRSLRLHFGGQENVDYSQIAQSTFVKPGTYCFTAFVRTQGITTEQGIAFRIFDRESPARLDVKTAQFVGTANWKSVEQMIPVPRETKVLTVQVIRPRFPWKFDNKIAGTVWIDTISLTKVD